MEQIIRHIRLSKGLTTVYCWHRIYSAQGKAGQISAYGNHKNKSSIPDGVFSKYVAIYNSESRTSSHTVYDVAKGYFEENYHGERVCLRRDMQNYRYAWVYSKSDELICRAEQQTLVKLLASDPISKENLDEGTYEQV
ncbi:hypothetical protein IJT17_06405 [bacterium]|nr:hypothetical protein [bacterium]